MQWWRADRFMADDISFNQLTADFLYTLSFCPVFSFFLLLRRLRDGR